MLGQGRPYATGVDGLRHTPQNRISRWRVLVVLLCALAGAPAAHAEMLDVRLRVTWGGGQPRLWRGSIFVEQGTLHDPRRLGIEPDLPGAMTLDGHTLRFRERTATSFDGFDVRVQAELSSVLTVQLSTDGANVPHTVNIPLRQLVDDPTFVSNSALDEPNNRLLIRRAPGDRLRVTFQRDALVFAPGEEFAFDVKPHCVGLPAGTGVRCQVQLLDMANEELWRQQFELLIDAQGNSAAQPVRVALPEREGVYTILVGLSQRRFADALMRSKLLMQRRLQLVVVSGGREPAILPNQHDQWKVVEELDLSDPNWWETWTWLPQFARLSGSIRSPLGNHTLGRQQRGDVTFLELAAQKWHAVPLPISQVGRPHVIEIEYPADTPQTMGISVLEPNAAGEVMPLFLDSGIDVPRAPLVASQQTEKHRLIFWPRTATPWLLLTNRRDDKPALFRGLRVLAGPDRLPAEELGTDERLVAAFYDKPFFPQNFMAPEALEDATVPARSLNDWQTFYEGGRRLVEYLKYAGYNSAMISVYRDGSALYPTALLESTPRYDNGVFFVSGQDPIPKDVLEMLFRLFDREGLKLIPTLHFATPLPHLEQALAADGVEAAGIRLADLRGDTWLERNRARNGLAPYYNPLDSRVQAGVREVMAELLARYAHHPSFAGVSLQLGSDTYLQFPDQQWGYDSKTWARFLASAEGAQAKWTPEEATQGVAREAWLEWRAAGVAAFHRQLAQQVSLRRSDARLYLIMADTLASSPVRQEMRPRLLAQGNFVDAMLRQGLDAGLYASEPAAVVLQPRRLAPLISLAEQGANLQISRSAQVDQFYRAAAAGGSLYFHESLPLRLAEFDTQGPFQSARTTAWLSAHIPPAGMHNRARFARSLAAFDSQILVDGGRMLPLGQEHHSHSLFRAFRRLPPGPFETVNPTTPAAKASELTVRTRALAGKTYAYVVNPYPWPVEAVLDVTCSPRCQWQALDGREVKPLEAAGPRRTARLALESYDVRAVVFDEPGVKIVDWQSPPAGPLHDSLATTFQEINARLNELRNPTPLKVIENPSFEQPLLDQQIPGWTVAQRPGVTASVDASNPADGRQALHLKVDSAHTVGWVRSRSFPLPRTGRIAVLASVRTRDGQQPPLRLAVDLLANGRPFDYLYTPLGVDVDGRTLQPTRYPAKPLSDEWPDNPFLFPVRELPTDGPTEVVIGFDLMGEGEVWIDDVQVFDLFFDENEQDELLRNFAPANFQLARGRFVECQRYLDGYWPRFLLEYVPRPEISRVATAPAVVAPPAAAPTTPSPDTSNEGSRSGWNRFVPQVPFRNPFSR